MNNPKTLLVIEDDPRFRRTLAAFLEDSGYRVLVAADGQEGLRLAAEEHPDLVLTDLRMPVMDGLEFIIQIKASGRKLPIIVISGTGDEKAQSEAVNQGAVECLRKPIDDMQVLQSTIERVLASEK